VAADRGLDLRRPARRSKVRYASVQRFARKVRGARLPEACAVITTEPGEEAQVDYGDGPMVRDPQTGKYRRMRLFLMTLGYSRTRRALQQVEAEY
jgi:transposase